MGDRKADLDGDLLESVTLLQFLHKLPEYTMGFLKDFGWPLVFTFLAVYVVSHQYQKYQSSLSRDNKFIKPAHKKELDEKLKLARLNQLEKYKQLVKEKGEAKSYKEIMKQKRKEKSKKVAHCSYDFASDDFTSRSDYMNIGGGSGRGGGNNQAARRFGQDRRRQSRR